METADSAATPMPRVEFMQELQRLFGLLFGSPRQAVDPTKVVQLLRAQVRGKVLSCL